MSNETTRTVELAQQQINAMLGDQEPKFLPSHARSVLSAALSVEEIAPILRQVATGNGGWTYLTERTKRKWREAAQEFRNTLLGGAS